MKDFSVNHIFIFSSMLSQWKPRMSKRDHLDSKNWEDSRANCLRYGADPVSILTSSKSDFNNYQQIRTNETIRTLTKYQGIWNGLFRNKTTGNQKEG